MISVFNPILLNYVMGYLYIDTRLKKKSFKNRRPFCPKIQQS